MALTITAQQLQALYPLALRPLIFERLPNGVLRYKDTHHAYRGLLNRIAGPVLARCGEMGASQSDVMRILHKYVSATASTRQGLPFYNTFTNGAIWKDFDIDSWDSLVELVTYELKSEVNYLTEIDLAEIVSLSPRVANSVERTITLLSKCFAVPAAIQAKLSPLQMNGVAKSSMEVALLALGAAWDELKPAYEGAQFVSGNKHYRSFVEGLAPHSLSDLATLAHGPDWNFEQKVAVMHDLLQVMFDYFDHDLVRPVNRLNPLQQDVSTLVGPNQLVPRNSANDLRSRAYAKSLARPSEAGPSYTTVRIASIPAAMTRIDNFRKHFNAVVRNANSAFATAAAAPITSIDIALDPLDDATVKDIIWAMFAYWTLHYQKSVTMAHTFYEVKEAAAQCGIQINQGEGYPALAEMAAAMEMHALVPSIATRLRKRSIKMGLTPSRVKDGAAMDAQTLHSFLPAQSGMSVRDLLDAYREIDAAQKRREAQEGRALASASAMRPLVDPFPQA